MSVDSLVYLLEVYWPFLTGAAIAGLLTGWFTYQVPGKPAATGKPVALRKPAAR